MSKEQHQSDSFVVRIWREHDDEAQWAWRGWVQHAASSEQCYFANVALLVAFIETHTGSLNSDAANPEQAHS